MIAIRQHTLTVLLFVTCLFGCSPEPDTGGTTDDRDATASIDPTHGDGSVPDDFVGCPGGVPAAAPGLSAKGQRLTVDVVAAVPAELERYINGFTVELRTQDGAPAPRAQVVRAQTFMPLHGHDGGVLPRVTHLTEPGRVQVERLNFIMRGPWEVRLWLRTEAGEDDYVTFTVCVAK